ncbi:MAG: DUF2802 domain-containing protein [Gammaproteobacteria bacterium]|nr:DUF2802 domain-containing protein [Gammaproteobacteria bacterium]
MAEFSLSNLLTVPAVASLAAVTLLLTVAFLLLVWRLQRLRRRHDEQVQALQSDMRALVSAAIGVGERVHRIEKSLREVSHRQEQQLDQTDPGGQTYQQAIKMAQKGAAAEELIEICGLTRGEADLIAMLHRMERTV